MIDFKNLRTKGAKHSTTPISKRESILHSYYCEYTQMTLESGFDPSIFMSATLTEANTRRPPLPAGVHLLGTIGEPKFRQTKGTKETNAGETYTWLDLPIDIELAQNPAIQQQLGGLEKVTLTYSVRIDIAPSGGFDMSVGKNNGLRQIREAVGMNTAGQPFAIPMLQGRSVLCKISNRPYQGEVFDGVDSIARPG